MSGPIQCDEGPTVSTASPQRGRSRGGDDGLAGLSLRQSIHAAACNQRGRLSSLSPLSQDPQHGSSSSTAGVLSPLTAIDESEKVGLEPYVAEEPPHGRHLLINLLSNLGDGADIGLTGIELFDGAGQPILVAPEWVVDSYEATGEETAITTQDPRRNPASLFDGFNNTSDSTHMYLAPYTPGGHHLVCVVFPHSVQISLMRIYNYNSNRVHSQKGTDVVEVTLDDEVIFRGQVQEGLGGHVCTDANPDLKHGIANAENVIFSEEPAVLQSILHWTAVADSQDELAGGLADVGEDSDAIMRDRAVLADKLKTLTMRFDSNDGPAPCTFPSEAPVVQQLAVEILSTWGDEDWVGLSSFEVIDANGGRLFPDQCSICRPNEPEGLPGDSDVSAILDSDPSTAAVWSFTPGMQLVVAFGAPVAVGSVRVANYGLGGTTHCGVKQANVHMTGAGGVAMTLSPPEGVVLRKGLSQSLTLRHQTFDLSLYVPRAGGSSDLGGGLMMGQGVTNSMTASMTARARVAMKRARMGTMETPEWLTKFQPYDVPLLPVAYVFKFIFCVNSASMPNDGTESQVLERWKTAVCGLDEEGKDLTPASRVVDDRTTIVEAATGTKLKGRVVSVLLVFDSPVALSACFLRDVELAPFVLSADIFADDELLLSLAPPEATEAAPSIVSTPAGGESIVIGATGSAAPSTAFFTFDSNILGRFFNNAA